MTSSQYPESNREGDSLPSDPDQTTGTDDEPAVESYSEGVFDQGHPADEPGEGVFDQGHPEPVHQEGQGVFDQGHGAPEHRHGQGVYEQGHSDTDDPEQDVPDDTDQPAR
jgi:hypothetical protein